MKFKKWTVWLANLDPVIGSEQGKTRPVVIVSENQINDVLSVVNILPVTSRKMNRSTTLTRHFCPKTNQD